MTPTDCRKAASAPNCCPSLRMQPDAWRRNRLQEGGVSFELLPTPTHAVKNSKAVKQWREGRVAVRSSEAVKQWRKGGWQSKVLRQ
eukprot:1150799-Pelagomonas_calceolata.AAC.6